MRFSVKLTHRKGRLLNHTAIHRSDAVVGDLRIGWGQDPRHQARRGETERPVRMATLLSADLGAGLRGDLLPTLYQPEVLGMGETRFSIGGYELHDGTEYRQSWLVEVVWRDKYPTPGPR